MRRFLTLVCLLCLAVPAGITISSCSRNPGANYCNGLGYGMKITDVDTITLQPATTGISLAFGQTQQSSAPSATYLQGHSGYRRRVYLWHHQQPVGGHLADRQHLRRNLEPELGRRHRRLHHLQLAQSTALDRRPALRHSLRHGLGQFSELQPGESLCACPGDLRQPSLVGTTQQCFSQGTRPHSTRRPALQSKERSMLCAPSSVTSGFNACPACRCPPA